MKGLTSLDSVYRGVREWAHRPRYQADAHMLVCGQFRNVRLVFVGELLELLINREVGGWATSGHG